MARLCQFGYIKAIDFLDGMALNSAKTNSECIFSTRFETTVQIGKSINNAMKLSVILTIIGFILLAYVPAADIELFESNQYLICQPVDTASLDTINGIFLYEKTSNFSSLSHSISLNRAYAIVPYDTLNSPSTSIYQNGIFTFCADGLCIPFMDKIVEQKRLLLKRRLDSLITREIKISNDNFEEREDMLGNITDIKPKFIYKVIKCTIVYNNTGNRDLFVTNFEKKSTEEPDYVSFNAPFFQIDTIISLTPFSLR